MTDSAESDHEYPAMTVDQVAEIRRLALNALGELGIEAVPGADGTTLVCADGETYGLDNLVIGCAKIPAEQWSATVIQHFTAMVRARSHPKVDQMDWPELECRLRSRVLSRQQIDHGGSVLRYAWPVAPGLGEVLCVDFPDTVAYVSGADVARHGVHRLWQVARSNTAAEPIDVVHDRTVDGGQYQVLAGESVFVGSRIADLQALVPRYLPEPSRGVVVGAPARNFLLVHQVDTASALLAAIDTMAAECGKLYANNPGPMSPDLYFWKHQRLQRIARVDVAKESIAVDVAGTLQDTLIELSR